jgi:hypothetical protein
MIPFTKIQSEVFIYSTTNARTAHVLWYNIGYCLFKNGTNTVQGIYKKESNAINAGKKYVKLGN